MLVSWALSTSPPLAAPLEWFIWCAHHTRTACTQARSSKRRLTALCCLLLFPAPTDPAVVGCLHPPAAFPLSPCASTHFRSQILRFAEAPGKPPISSAVLDCWVLLALNVPVAADFPLFLFTHVRYPLWITASLPWSQEQFCFKLIVSLEELLLYLNFPLFLIKNSDTQHTLILTAQPI